MTEPQTAEAPQGLGRLPRLVQWLILGCASAVLAALFHIVGLPAPFLLGPMIVAVVAGVNGARIRPIRPLFWSAQALVGVLIALSVEPRIVDFLVVDWGPIGGAVLATVAASSLLGYLISRWGVLPGTTGVWGSAPGASTAMVLMAEAFGADARLVAFMQYLRVIMVSLAAALVAGFWVDTSGVTAPAQPWFPPVDATALPLALGTAVLGGLAGRLLRLPSPFFLGAFALGVGLRLGFGLPLQLPPWLLVAAYTLIGWNIGLNFTRPVLLLAARALPQLVLSILLLMAFCGGIAFTLAELLGIDPLTAYLATSPGGMDSVAIIAAASDRVDLSFVMALQLARFLLVLIAGPPLARWVARRIG